MAYDPGALEAALAAAVGDDSALIAELRGAFFASAEAHVAAMMRATDGTEWRDAARRLKGLAASFGALRVMDAASRAEETRGPESMRRIARALAVLGD